MLAYTLESNARCTMCGTAAWEWEENRFAYTPVEEFCQGCYQKSTYSESQGKTLPGTNVKLVPTTPILKAKMFLAMRKRARKLKE